MANFFKILRVLPKHVEKSGCLEMENRENIVKNLFSVVEEFGNFGFERRIYLSQIRREDKPINGMGRSPNYDHLIDGDN